VTVESWTSADATRLIAELTAELDQRYAGIDTDDEDTELGALSDATWFVVAMRAGEAVGCGAYVPWDERHGEIKRVYVRPEGRGQGVARAIMQAIEQRAVEVGVSALFLETGTMQPEAISLYRSLGYVQVPCGARLRSAGWSVCMQKDLGGGD